jgi:hypothetical protein
MIFSLMFMVFLWYLYTGMECTLNGGDLGRRYPWLAPLQYFWQELTWSLPGGMRKKAAYIRERVELSEHGTIGGRQKSWDYHEVREAQSYAACAKDSLITPTAFWLIQIIVLSIGFGMGSLILWLFSEASSWLI